jgi:hypothetical protein
MKIKQLLIDALLHFVGFVVMCGLGYMFALAFISNS